jgi:hypothetical protein
MSAVPVTFSNNSINEFNALYGDGQPSIQFLTHASLSSILDSIQILIDNHTTQNETSGK